jgi:serine/threonine protein kinase
LPSWYGPRVLREGDLLAGKYRIGRPLGEGGMGHVVAAVHEQLRQRVAVKFLSGDHAKHPDAAARFLREARAAVRIQNEHVARVIDVAQFEDGSPYIVMEFLDGNDLAEELARVGVFDPAIAIDFVLQACEAIAEAHALGLVHRDLKPANLFLTRRADDSPLVKVLDFGISKAVSTSAPHESAALTTAQAILGSPAYMSPEQARTPKAVDHRTDIWSLGIILYEFLTGRVPFTGDTLLSVIAAAVVERPASVRTLRPELPEEIELVIERCLEKSPEDRYATIAELAEALEPFAEAHSLSSVMRVRGTVMRGSVPPASNVARSRPPPTREPDDTQPNEERRAVGRSTSRSDTVAVGELAAREQAAKTPKPETLTDWGGSSAQPGRSRQWLFAAGGAGLVLLAVALWLFSRSRGETSASPRPPSASGPEVIAADRGTVTPALRAAVADVTTAPVVVPAPTLPSGANPSASSAATVTGVRPTKTPSRPAVKTSKPAEQPVLAHPVNPLDGRL